MTTSALSIGLVIFATFIGALGSFFLKLGADKLESPGLNTKTLKKVLKNKFLVIGVILYGISSPIFLIALRGGELSVLYPFVALSYIWIILFSVKFLKERMNLMKTLGMIIIIISVILVGMGA